MPLEENLKREIVRIILAYKQPQKIILYGSQARGDDTKSSDIDLAIDDNHWTDRDTGEVKALLEEKIKTIHTFDVVCVNTLQKKPLKQNILKEGIVLYDHK